jgi:hypothetical protein|tara:strand:- start:911 stop:2338 length:1428 start_codon:yes stop_codon:yes gene_type:complete
MVPKLHPKGLSFKGAAAYLLHDKGADTSDRVAWTSTRNLATQDANIAWRVMAATAMDQQRLKQNAGIKNTGRKSARSVLHLTLSWHEDQADELDHAAMLNAAESAIDALSASDHQAMIVSHTDEPHPHVHILINRVNPSDGRMLSSSKEKLKLSQWAEDYEKQSGKVYCHERVINNAARRRGEYVRGVRSQARHLYEAEQQMPANDNMAQNVRDTERRRDAAVGKRMREMRQRHKQEWARLEQNHKQRIEAIHGETAKAIGRKVSEVRQGFRSRWAELHHQHEAKLQAFQQDEKSFLGRIKNRFKAVDLKRLVTGRDKSRVITETFGVVANKGERIKAVKRKQCDAERKLTLEQKREERSAAQKERKRGERRLTDNQRRLEAERSQLILSQKMDKAALRANWRERSKQRAVAFTRYTRQHAARLRQTEANHPNEMLPRGAENEQGDMPYDLRNRMQSRASQRSRDRVRDDHDRER